MQIREVITTVLKEAMPMKEAGKLIKTKSTEMPKSDQMRFIEVVETEILALHEGNFARYKVSPKEFEHWKSVWQ